MRTRGRQVFTTVRSEGGLLPPDVLQRIVARDTSLGGLTPADYHLAEGERLNEAVNRSWTRLRSAWASFSAARARLGASDPGTTPTRDRWLLILFQELGYGRLPVTAAIEADGRAHAISHLWQRTPIHLVGCNVDLERRERGVRGAATSSPHGLLQELLNRSDDHLFGFVSNGLCLRLLRDNASLTRQAFVEFDLEALMEGEVYSDFVLLWLVCHESRVGTDRPEASWLERWRERGQEDGTRALEGLRLGVQRAIEALGGGFVTHPANGSLRDALRTGSLGGDDLYRELLRLVYRLLFLFVAEDRGVLLDPDAKPDARQRFLRYYATGRLRALSLRQRGSAHGDLWRGLRVVMDALGREEGAPGLALRPFGSLLWSPESLPHLAGTELANRDLLTALRALSETEQGRLRRTIDYRNLGPEELGSVYESLLELHPDLDTGARSPADAFRLATAGGSERKTTGSYYTPTSLIQCLLDTALDPVVEAAVARKTPEEAERALLALRVCDPACGSGHFLLAAAQRLAKRLAAIRTGDEEPAPEALRRALRDVIHHCLYGVDANPMAVELCKVALWMEALEPGRPLGFLDHRIRCGNSLLGTTPALLARGIPDEAFAELEGDDKAVVRDLRKRNRAERAGQTDLFSGLGATPADEAARLAREIAGIDALGDESLAAVREKEARWQRALDSTPARHATLVADAWCSAFVARKQRGAPDCVTEDVFRRLLERPASVPAQVRDEVDRLARQYRFFHWHLAFPDVFRVPKAGETAESEVCGWSGGFDVVLGNPPWERIKLQEKEFFAASAPEIASAPTAAARKKMIAKLAKEDAALFAAFGDAVRQAEGESHFVRSSDRFPLCGRGDVNTYAVFAETMRSLVAPRGNAGCIVPTGIATDDTTKHFFADLTGTGTLASLYDFENREGLFPAVDSRMKFSLLTMGGASARAPEGAEFAFFLHRTSDLAESDRRFRLSADDIALLNPNTKTCPVFRSRRDAELTKAIYRRVPVLIREGPPEENPWGVSFMRMFDMSNDSHLFRTRDQLEAEGARLEGNVFVKGKERWLPLYEAKMIHHFDHRWATYDGGITREFTETEQRNPECVVLPRYWVLQVEVESRLCSRWSKTWLLGWRDICRSTDERTVIAAIVPRAGIGNKIPLMFPSSVNPRRVSALLADQCSLAHDFAARQKIASATLNFFILHQLPDLAPQSYSAPALSFGSMPLDEWISARVLELAYTTSDLSGFSSDLGYDGPPYRWDKARRFLLRCELDAAFFHLYLGTPREWVDQGTPELLDAFPTPRDAVSYIMDTFPIVRRHDEAEHGEYRTKRLILEIYDDMTRAIETGTPYQTRLDPPPADPRVAHSADDHTERRGAR